METLESNHTPSPSSSLASSLTDPNLQNPSFRSPAPAPSASMARLWRPAAQRNLKNQWLKLASYRQQWVSASSSGRSHATSLVNSYLSQRYLPAMDLGVLSDMPNIRNKASCKLFRRQELDRGKLLSSYRDMVSVVTHMLNTSGSMRCFAKAASGGSLLQFSSFQEDDNDLVDCGGVPAFTFLSVSSFEKLAQELVEMFVLELNLKRLLVVELLAICPEKISRVKRLNWSDELYSGEFDDLCMCNLYSKKTSELVSPIIKGYKTGALPIQSTQQPDHEVLQVYLTTWLAAVNIDDYRINEIFSIVGEEMHVSLL